jgi:hypothetical protein
MDFPILVISIGVLVIFLAIFMLIKVRKYGHKPNYKAFSVIGITWIPLGIIMRNYVFLIVGLVFTFIGIINRKKTEENVGWQELPPEVRRIKIILIVILAVLALAGVVTYFIIQNIVGQIEI